MTKRVQQKRESGPANWLACFEIDEPDTHQRIGSFQMLVHAGSCDDALTQCERRLRELHTTGKHFADPCTIYLLHLIRLPAVMPGPALVNYSDTIIYGENATGSITCGVVDQQGGALEAYGTAPDDETGEEGRDVEDREHFVDFGGKRFRAALRKALGRMNDDTPVPASARVPKKRKGGWRGR